jgi:cephalosporin hydroxylase
MNLWQDFQTNDKKIIHKWEHYFPIYERFLNKFRNTTVTIIEIGVAKGGSLQMWERYLGPLATVVGIDIDPDCQEHAVDNIHVRIGNQSDTKFLQTVVNDFGAPDIVIDDGSHVMKDVLTSFEILYPALSKNGIYIVEDMHTAYWPEYGGGFDEENTFLNYSKAFVDKINAYHSRGAIKPDFATENTFGISFFDSVVVFERGNIPVRNAPMRGGAQE